MNFNLSVVYIILGIFLYIVAICMMNAYGVHTGSVIQVIKSMCFLYRELQ